ncbi:MAG: hypothetical protein ACOCV1_08490 [Bacillota bacterium]
MKRNESKEIQEKLDNFFERKLNEKEEMEALKQEKVDLYELLELTKEQKYKVEEVFREEGARKGILKAMEEVGVEIDEENMSNIYWEEIKRLDQEMINNK